MTPGDTASRLAFQTDAIRNEGRWLIEQAKRVADTMDSAHPVMSESWKLIRDLEYENKRLREYVASSASAGCATAKELLTALDDV